MYAKEESIRKELGGKRCMGKKILNSGRNGHLNGPKEEVGGGIASVRQPLMLWLALEPQQEESLATSVRRGSEAVTSISWLL